MARFANPQRRPGLGWLPLALAALAVPSGCSRAPAALGVRDARPDLIDRHLRDVAFAPGGRTGAAVGFDGRIAHTTDGGRTWRRLPAATVHRLYALDYLDEERAVAVGGSGTVLASSDGGRGWRVERTGAPERLTGVAHLGERLFVAGDGGAVLAGRWGALAELRPLAAPPGGPLRAIQAVPPSALWACGYEGRVLRSSDAGATWSESGPGPGNALYGLLAGGPDRAWLAGSFGRILQTSDGGASWQELETGTRRYLRDLARGPVGRLAAVGYGFVLESRDDGLTWQRSELDPDAELMAVAFGATGPVAVGSHGVIAAGTPEGWVMRAPAGRSLRAVAFGSARQGWAFGDGGTALASTDGGASWQARARLGDQPLLDADFPDPEHGWVLAENSLYRTRDGGHSFEQLAPPLGQPPRALDFLTAEVGWVAGAGGSVASTTDGGASWSMGRPGTGADLTAIAFWDHRRGLAGGGPERVFGSQDGGLSWPGQYSGLDEPVVDLALAPPGLALALSRDGRLLVSRCSGDGSSWDRVAWPAPVRPAALAAGSGWWWAVGPDGWVGRSTDPGGPWASVRTEAGVDFLAVAAIAPGSACAVGRHGAIYLLESDR